MAEDSGMAPAGWYPVWDGRQERWWDGTAWSDHVRDPQPAVQGELVTQEPSRPNRTVARVTDLATASHQTRSLPEGTLWSAVGKPLTGFGAGRYRLDSQFLYYEEGTLRTDSQQVQVVYVHDIDVKQSMSQKARNVFTVIVHAGGQLVKLEDIEDGYLAQQRTTTRRTRRVWPSSSAIPRSVTRGPRRTQHKSTSSKRPPLRPRPQLASGAPQHPRPATTCWRS